MDPNLVGDLVGGLFTGSFVIGLFFGSLSVLISLKHSKNATNMIIILIAILFNFLTPLSALFFDTPSKVLSNQGINLIQQNVKTRKIENKNIVFQVTSTFGQTKFEDVKQKYHEANKETFYSNSFYLNFGNMIGSLYNLGGLAPYHNGNISISPNNTTWNFIDKINIDEYPYIYTGIPNLNLESNNLINNSLSQQIMFLPEPTSSFSLFFSTSPKYTYLSNPNNNETTSVVPNDKFYVKDSTKVTNALVNINNSTLNLFNNNSNVVNSITNTINQITNTDDVLNNLSKISQEFNSLLTKDNMLVFKENFEANYNKNLNANNEEIAENVFSNQVNLFYGLDELSNISNSTLDQQFIKDVVANNKFNQINNTFLTQNDNWNLLDSYFEKTFGWYPKLKSVVTQTNQNDEIKQRNELIGTSLQIIFTNQYSVIYLTNLLTNDTKNNNYKTSLGLIPLSQSQIKYSYVVNTVPIVDPTIIVILMIVISFSLFVGIGFIYYHEDIR